MGWFRSRVRLGAWVAVFALVAQLGLSFGHVHAIGVEHPTVVAALAADNGSTRACPTGAHSDNDYCATCAVLAMLSGAQTASAPVAPVPFALAWVERLTSADTIVRQPARVVFQSRAPPQA